LRVAIQKFDPYINVDPGTMSPFQHGEVYVTDDGAETDLDLGHYERFTSARMSRDCNYTAGQIYNLGGGPDFTLSIWAEFGPLTEELLGRPVAVRRGDWRPGDQKIFIADVRKAEREFGWRPRVSPADGIPRLFRWVQDHRHLFRR